MKKLLSIVLLFICLFAKAQTGTYTLVPGNWLYKFVKVDSAYRGPQDTLASAPQGATAVKGTTLYIKGSDNFWHAITGAGGSGVWGFISGSLSAQSDLVAKFGTKYDTSVRKVDTLYAITDSTFGYYVNGQFRTFKFRGTLTSFNGRNGAIVLTLIDVTTALGYTPSNLPNVTNLLQVINAGGATSLATGLYVSRPVAGSSGRFYVAVDSFKMYFDNGTSWITIGGSSGGGGGSGTVTLVNTGYGVSGGPINSSGTIVIDSATLSLYYVRRKDSGSVYVTPLMLSAKEPVITAANTVNTYWNGYKQFVSLNSDSIFEGTTHKFNKLPAGGTIGQVATKNSSTDFDVSWQTPSSGSGNPNTYKANGQPGDTSYVSGNGSGNQIKVAAHRDSIDHYTVINSDSSRTSYVQAHDTTSANALQTKYRSDTARADFYAALALKKNIVDSGYGNGSNYQTIAGGQKKADSLGALIGAKLSAVSVTNSITGNGAGTPLQLSGDAATPADGTFYGKQGGVKGWYTPSGTAYDSATSQGAAGAGGFHTQAYNDIRYSKSYTDSLKLGLIKDTLKLGHKGAIWGLYPSPAGDSLYDKGWNNSAGGDADVVTGTDSANHITFHTVNSNVGSFGDATHVGQITANGKGLLTAASNVLIQIPESQVTNLTSDLAGKVDSTLRQPGTDSNYYYVSGVKHFAGRDTLLNVKIVSSGYISIDSSQKMGTIYDSTSWNNLAFFSNVGSNYSVNGTTHKIVTSNYTSGSGALEFPNATMLDQDIWGLNYKYITKNSGDFGPSIYLNSIGNPSQSKADLAFYLSIHSGTVGKLVIVSVVNGVEKDSVSSTSLTGGVSIGDSIGYLVNHTPSGYVFTVTNYTTGNTLSMGIATNYTYPGAGVEHNTAKLQIYTGNLTNSTIEIDRISWSSNQPKNAVLLVRANSIGNRSFAQSSVGGFVDLIHATNESGPGDITAAYLATEAEIIAQHPKNVFIDYTGNDQSFGISSTTTRSNLTTFYNDLTAAGINCYFLSTTPRNAIDVTPNLTWLTSNYPGRFIDCTTPLLGSGSSLNNLYNAGDGTHLNGAGHAVKASAIISSSIYQSIINGLQARYVSDPGFDSTESLAIPNIGYLNKRLSTFTGGGLSGLTSGKIPVANGSNSITDGPLQVSSGNVGFGVSPSYLADLGGYNTTNAHLRMGDLVLGSFNNSNTYIGYNVKNSSGYKYINNGTGALINFDGGILLATNPSGTAGGSASFNIGLQVVNNGHSLFGTQTDSGSALVQVNGRLKLKADSNATANGGYVTRNFNTGLLELVPAPSGGGGGGISGLTIGKIPVATSSTTIGDGPLVVSSGQVGFGVAPSYLGDFGSYLTTGPQIRFGNMFLQSYNSNNHYLLNNAYNLSGAYKYVVTGTASAFLFSDGAGMMVAPSGTAGTSVTWNVPFFIPAATHNVLINRGTTDDATNAVQIGGKALFYGLADYDKNYGSTYTIRSHVDKNYVDSSISAHSGSGYTTIQNATASVTARTKINYPSASGGPQLTATDNSGNGSTDITIANLSSGQYTPTLTATANCSGVSLTQASYSRNGNIIHVNISGTFTATASGAVTSITATLPSGLANSYSNGTWVGSGTCTPPVISGAAPAMAVYVNVLNSTTAQLSTFFTGGTGSGSLFMIQLDYSL